MIALRLVHLIEAHADELTEELVKKFQTSPRTSDLGKVPAEELRNRNSEIFLSSSFEPRPPFATSSILHHLSDWLLSKSDSEVERRYSEMGALRAIQGVSLADVCWAIVLTKEHVWDFLQSQGFLRGPLEIYGEMELLRLLDQFFDRATCYVVEGYER